MSSKTEFFVSFSGHFSLRGGASIHSVSLNSISYNNGTCHFTFSSDPVTSFQRHDYTQRHLSLNAAYFFSITSSSPSVVTIGFT